MHGDGNIETVKINDRRGKKVESGSTLKFKATVDNLPEDEKAVFESCFGWNASIFDWKQRLASSRGPHLTPSTTPKLSRFTREYFERLIDWLGGYYYFERQELKYHKKHVEFVVVGRYTVPRNLSRILVLMLRKHGDISSHSESTREMKSIVFSCLCEVLHSMSTTKVRDLTQDHLKEWYFYLNFARRRGFNVEFLSEKLKHVVRAFLGLQATATRPYNSHCCAIEEVKKDDDHDLKLEEELDFLKSKRFERDIKRVVTRDILELQKELDNLKSESYISFIKWGEFTMECLDVALKLIEEDHVAGNLLQV
ncbi:Phospholipase-like [Trema orientale]|uniref:Phospholipase-like n=1 Tax=Trema orientale TaxID=63057 RepID=A0A2P5F4C7_TREOI|nr:Phospholipase-like [Trema orientale]